jgi:hypothetical protein
MNTTPIIEIEEFDAETFELNYHCANSYDSFYLKGTIILEEEESLWGDQVSACHLVAKVNEITEVFQFDEEGEEMNHVNLELAREAMQAIERKEEVLDTKYYSINYNL